MNVRAVLSNVHASPRKTRIDADTVRGMDVLEAEFQLRESTRKGATLILKVLESAIANGIHNHNMVKENLFVEKIMVNEGPVLKRWMSRAFGRATPIHRPLASIEIVLGERVAGRRGKKAPKKEVPAPAEKAAEKEEGTSAQKQGAGIKKPAQKGPVKKNSFQGLKNRFFRRKAGGS